MRKILTMLTIAAFALAVVPGRALAGAPARHRVNGAGVVLGALGLMAVLSIIERGAEASIRYRDYGTPAAPQRHERYDHYDRNDQYNRYERYERDDRHDGDERCDRREEVYVPGHWEMVEVWVPGHWETVWIEGGYDHRGEWQPGRWENKAVGGGYERRRVWIREKELPR